MSANTESGSAGAWLNLEQTCEAALRLSREVASHIDGSAGVGDYVPLLRRQLILADEVRSQIARLGGLGPSRHGERRKRVIGRLVELLDLEQSNQTMLSRRGARITAGTRLGAAAFGA